MVKNSENVFSSIDVHSHLYLCKQPLNQLLENAAQAGVKYMLNIAINIESSRKVLVMHKRHSQCLPTIGIHPCEHASLERVDELEGLLLKNKDQVKAIAEIGLDYYWRQDNKKQQQLAFEKQCDLAQRYDLPVIIHNRKADEDIASICKNFPSLKKVFHCFMGGPQFLQELMDENSFFSFTGSITYAKKGKTIQAIKALPLDRCLIETDCPYLVPKQQEGKENQPAYVCYVRDKIAEIKQLTIDKVSENLYANAKKLLAI